MTNKEKEIDTTETKTEQVVSEDEKVEEAEEVKQEPAVDPLEEANDKYLRLAAEYDNFKRRTQKEKTQIYVDAAASVIEQILPFLDNLDRAAAVEVKSEDAVKLKEGITLVKRQFNDALCAIGVEEIKAVGEKFDPNVHNAVMHVDDDQIDGEEIVV